MGRILNRIKIRLSEKSAFVLMITLVAVTVNEPDMSVAQASEAGILGCTEMKALLSVSHHSPLRRLKPVEDGRRLDNRRQLKSCFRVTC
jgi:hypothetical protein